MKHPLVSVIVPTYNSAGFLDACLASIKGQSYSHIELIVVDNNSRDNTKQIARKYTNNVFNKTPERSAQRNYGVAESSGKYVLIIDSDMELTPRVIEACVEKAESNSSIKGVIIPEESFGEGFWAQCKKLERSFYVGVDWMEAARFFDKKSYIQVGGYDEEMVSGEDWDLSQRIELSGEISRIDEFIKHNEGEISLIKTIKKKYYYASQFTSYTSKNAANIKSKKQTSITKRYALFFSKPSKLLKNPLLGGGMLVMKTSELAFGGLAILRTVLKRRVLR